MPSRALSRPPALAPPAPLQIRLYDVNSSNPQPVLSFDGHAGNVTAVGFQKDATWLFSGSEDGTVKLWDVRAPGCQREYASRAPVNAAVPGIETGSRSGFCETTAPHADSEKVPVE